MARHTLNPLLARVLWRLIFVLVPIEPSGLSTWASDLTVRQVQEAQELKIIKCCFVVSRKPPKSTTTTRARRAYLNAARRFDAWCDARGLHSDLGRLPCI